MKTYEVCYDILLLAPKYLKAYYVNDTWPDLVGGAHPLREICTPPEKVAPPCNYLHPPGKV